MIVYLAGPINGCTDDEANSWRDLVKAALGADNCLDPMRRDYRGHEMGHVSEIVQLDKADIRASDIVLANCWQPSWGTAMEIHYAWTYLKPVIAIVQPHLSVSPWIRYHSEAVVTSLDDAIARVRQGK